MKRHESLHALSQHHHFALMQALFIRRASEESSARRQPALREVAEGFLQFWEEKGKLHFHEEEAIVLPALSKHISVESDGDMMRMLAEHASIRAKITDLRTLLTYSEPFETKISELGRLLHDHVRFEENVIFPRIEKILTDEELLYIGRLLTNLHPKACEI